MARCGIAKQDLSDRAEGLFSNLSKELQHRLDWRRLACFQANHLGAVFAVEATQSPSRRGDSRRVRVAGKNCLNGFDDACPAFPIAIGCEFDCLFEPDDDV
jgi:hypothetical protein